MSSIPRLKLPVLKGESDGFNAWGKAHKGLYAFLSAPGGEIIGDTYFLPSACLTKTAATAISIERTDAEIRSGGLDLLTLHLLMEGRLELDCRRGSVQVDAGDIVFLETNLPHAIRAKGATFITVLVDPGILGQLAAGVIHGARLPGSMAATDLLSRSFEALLTSLDVMHLSQAEATLRSIVLLTLRFWHQHVTPGASLPNLARRVAAEGLIEAQLRDPVLSASRAAAHLGLSRATLYRMFKASGGVENFIIERRLDLCLKTLVRSAGLKWTPKDLATEHGFKNEATFSRAFLDRYGASPQTMIAKLRNQDAADGESALAPLTNWLGQTALLHNVRARASI